MITRRDLANELGKRGLADWVVIQRDQELASFDERAKVKRAEQRTLWQITVHYDAPAGRGSAFVTVDAVDGTATAAVDQVVALAQASIGPAWISRPLAAPARVDLEDEAIAKAAPLEVVTDIVKKLKRPADVAASAALLREHVQVQARQGFHTEWRATQLRVDALVIASDRSVAITREARQRSGLGIDDAIAQAKQDLDALAGAAAPPPPGPCALVLAADALLHGDELGVWTAFAAQADAVIERQGLTRYREHAPIVPGADQIGEPLTIVSNGALPYGVRSAPLGDQGEAVRAFMLVERGIAAGLGLTPREGSLRGRDPNGGVRNLEVAAGSWGGAIDDSTLRVLEIRRLRSLTIDPYTGDASLEIGLGIAHDKGSAKPFTGGSLRLDLIAALARAKRSARLITRGAYKGPEAVWIDRTELIA